MRASLEPVVSCVVRMNTPKREPMLPSDWAPGLPHAEYVDTDWLYDEVEDQVAELDIPNMEDE